MEFREKKELEEAVETILLADQEEVENLPDILQDEVEKIRGMDR